MIAALDGQILRIAPDSVLIMTPHVGYLVRVNQKLLQRVKPHDQLFLFTYTHVREDLLELFGFETAEELKIFEMLLSVSGIGPKTALAVLEKGVAPLENAIARGDAAFFKGIPRLGSKNAQKIILELKSKFKANQISSGINDFFADATELTTALLQMGFSRDEVAGIEKQLAESDLSFNAKLKYALKLLDPLGK